MEYIFNQHLDAALRQAWTVDMKNQFNIGVVSSERAMQAELYYSLRTLLNEKYKIFVEPIEIRIKGNLKGMVPDLIITHEQEIICIIEIKYMPWKNILHKNDMDKINFYSTLSKVEQGIKINPLTGDYIQNEFTYSESLVTIFAAIGKSTSQPFDLKNWSGTKNTYLFIGTKNNENLDSIVFEIKSIHEID